MKTGMMSARTVRSIRRATRKKYNAEEKVRIVLEGLRGERMIAELCLSFIMDFDAIPHE